jgi:hypothetical protein
MMPFIGQSLKVPARNEKTKFCGERAPALIQVGVHASACSDAEGGVGDKLKLELQLPPRSLGRNARTILPPRYLGGYDVLSFVNARSASF